MAREGERVCVSERERERKGQEGLRVIMPPSPDTGPGSTRKASVGPTALRMALGDFPR